MSELIDRLMARTLSDIKRGVPFYDGMKNFGQLIRESINEMDKRVKRMEELIEKIERMS